MFTLAIIELVIQRNESARTKIILNDQFIDQARDFN